MQPQLQAIVDEFEAAHRRLHELAAAVPAGRWSERTSPRRWSMGECVAHLNLTSRAFAPLVQAALVAAQALPRPAGGRYRRDLMGWMLWHGSGPAPRQRFKTTAPFVPAGVQPLAELLDEFDAWHATQIAAVRTAEGLDLQRVKILSPFNGRTRYNLYSCLTILPRHEHRHLWQAEQVWATLRRAPAPQPQPS